MKPVSCLCPLLLLALAALACRAPGPAPDNQVEAIETAHASVEANRPYTEIPGSGNGPTPEASVTATPIPTQTEAGRTEASPPAGKPPQSQRAEIRPVELRAALTRASALIGFQVLDRDGAFLGTVADFVINTCETYLIYFLLAPAEELDSPAGSRLVVPYEAVTINSGALDAQAQAIQLSLAAGQFTGAPAFAESQELVPTDWEAEVRAFWSQIVRLSNLTTGCRVAAPGGGTTEVYKVAHTSELIGAELRDGLQNGLGQVEEIILEPESGKASFFVIRLGAGGGLVLVPLRAVNIPKEALGPGSEISLVLLTENELLLNAPQIQTVEEAVQMRAQGAAWGYWGR